MWPFISQFLIEIIKSSKRGLFLTITALMILVLMAYHYSVAKPELQNFKYRELDSLRIERGKEYDRIIRDLSQINKELGEIKSNLNQTNQNVLELYKDPRKNRR